MERDLLDDRRENGGFPDPPATGPVRVVAARHPVCGARTRVRLPAVVPASAVRRLRCETCAERYETESVEEVAAEEVAVEAAPPARPRRRPALPRIAIPRPSGTFFAGRTWRWLSVPLGAAAVIAVLLLIQGGGDEVPIAAPEPAGDGAAGAATAEVDAPRDARLVRGSSFTLALPAGWQRERDAPSDATFAAAAADGSADATLWVQRAPGLGLRAFERRSLAQLRSAAGGARVVERVDAPTAAGTIVRLAADSPAGEPSLEVTLRAAGPFRYYLATTVQPDASRTAVDGAELLHGTLTPDPPRN